MAAEELLAIDPVSVAELRNGFLEGSMDDSIVNELVSLR